MSPPQRETERGSVLRIQNHKVWIRSQLQKAPGNQSIFLLNKDCTPKYQTKDLSQSYALLSPLKVAKVPKSLCTSIQVIRTNENLNSNQNLIPTHQNGNGRRITFERTPRAEAVRQGKARPCRPRWTRSGGHHPVEEAEGVGVDPRRGDGGVGSVRGGGVPLADAGVLRGHDRHAHLLHLDQRLRFPEPAGSTDPGDDPVGEDGEAGDPGPAQAAHLVRAPAVRHRLRGGHQEVHHDGGVPVHRVGRRDLLQLAHPALPRCGVHDDGAGAVRAVRARGGAPGGHGGARRPDPLGQDGLRRAPEDPQGQRRHHRRTTRGDGQQRARVASLPRQLKPTQPTQQHVRYCHYLTCKVH